MLLAEKKTKIKGERESALEPFNYLFEDPLQFKWQGLTLHMRSQCVCCPPAENKGRRIGLLEFFL